LFRSLLQPNPIWVLNSSQNPIGSNRINRKVSPLFSKSISLFSYLFKSIVFKVVLNAYNASREDWIIANVKHSGFYRVNYDAHNWKLLVNQLNSDRFEMIDVINRGSLIDDAFNLGRAELVDQTLFLDIVKYLRNETSSLPFAASYDGLDFIQNMLSFDMENFRLIKVSFHIFLKFIENFQN